MSDSDEEYGPPLPPGLSTPASSADTEKDRGPQSQRCSSSSSASAPRICTVQPSHLVNTSNYTSDSDSDSDNSDNDTKNSLHKEDNTSASGIGPVLPPHLQHLSRATAQSSSDDDDDDGDVGPSLPPHLLHAARSHSSHATRDHVRDNDSSDEGDIGPSVSLQASSDDQSALRDFEIRAQKMKDRLEGKEEEADSGPQKRESWMTELPSALNKQYAVLENRQFRKNAAPEQDASWTETPEEKERRQKEGGSAGKKRKHEVGYQPNEEDLKAAAEIEKFNKKNRSKTLLEMHQKELKKKKKKEKKKNKKNKDKSNERRPFDRDADLQVNRLDDAKRKAIIKRSQELSSRFKTGGTGTSFL